MELEESLNYQTMKEGYHSYKQTIRKTLISLFKTIPREDIIKVLKDLKIIKSALNPKTNEFEWVERK